ncbi:hypothetical protein [Micromonospora rubida]|uniref:hypothetical protein n=1 Tax=Micromonospora rubida TaxID=2697657 RepID=UPI0013779474|nr:hypothetical protein [Micromonospora rubida]NBE79634.1 hypothetical protein [Micromonospora rubida]
MIRRRISRTFLRVFSTFGLALAITLTALATWSIADECRGADAVAEVAGVEHRGARTFLTVQFTTDRGELCQSTLRATVDTNQAVSIGERIPVHHARSDPCLRVREVGDQFGWLIIPGAVALLITFAILTYLAWRRPRPTLPLRYADMP